ncbi:MAG: NUDIX domain-containing protein [Candidatus Thalassarchaeaceae archaeon]|nr:NUDIX domain-containing protein [Candidatus Thalassarchaeaceae archaeon]
MDARVWLTGFQPFGTHSENISKILADQLISSTHSVSVDTTPPFGLEQNNINLIFEGEILSVDESGSRQTSESLRETLPDAVIHLGLKETATQVHLEMCAINESNFRIADNSGRQLSNQLIDQSGLALLHTTVHRPSLEIFSNQFTDVIISEDCGRFVCNETYYRTLHEIESKDLQHRQRALPAIFIHLPPIEFVPLSRQMEIVLDIAARIVQKPTIQVVGGAVISPDGKMLACRRSPDEVMAGWWEFPGGKVDVGETEIEALQREMMEELNLNVNVGNCIGRHDHDFGPIIVNLAFYTCVADHQEITLHVHDEFKWFTEAEAPTIKWLPPDVDFILHLAELGFMTLRDAI